MRNIIFILMLCMSVPFLNAQNPDSTLEGFVFRSQTNAPLEGVNVIILGTNLGDATNADGYYKIEQIIPGEYELEFKLIGYKTQRMRLKIASDKITKRDVTLDPKVLKGKEVSVEGERVDDIRLKVSPPTFKLHPQDVVGLPGAIEDVMRSIQTLPGVLATSDYSNQFIVRGGGPDQNLILLDDVEIYNPYRSSGMPSLINPAIIQSINLYTGGFPAIFGDRLSSVLTMHTRDGTNQKWLAGQIGLDFIKADWVLEGKLPTLNGSWLVSGRRTHNGLFAEDFSKRLTLNSVAFPNFEDWHAKLVLRPNEKTRWQVHGVFGKNDQDWLIKGELGEQDSDRDQLDGEDNIENLAIGASWNYLPTSDVQVKAFVNWYKNSGHSGLQGDFIPRNDRFSPDQPFPPPPPFGVTDTTFFNYHQLFNFKKFSAGGWMVQQTEKHVPEIGLGLDFFDNSIGAELEIDEFGRTIMNTLSKAPNWFGALADSANVNSRYQRFYIYVQNKMAFMNGRLHIQPGIRYDLYGVTDSQYLSPRLKITYRLDQDTEINAAWGLYRQSPGFEKLLDGGEVFDVLKFGELNGLVAEKAMHSVLGVTRSFHDRFFLTLETYYKKFDDLVSQLTRLLPLPKGVYQADAPGRANSYKIVDVPTFSKIPVADNNLTGRAYGLDVLLEKRLDGPSDKWSGWVSYSLAHS
ncbi:MAG: TonB-dependent receptor domain-containing protein, partial [bacterium]